MSTLQDVGNGIASTWRKTKAAADSVQASIVDRITGRDRSGDDPADSSGFLPPLPKPIAICAAAFAKFFDKHFCGPGKMFGEDHMLGKILALAAPPGSFTDAELAKMTGEPAHMEEFKKFDPADSKNKNTPEYARLDDLAKKAGFPDIQKAHEAALMGFNSNDQLQALAPDAAPPAQGTTAQTAAAPGSARNPPRGTLRVDHSAASLTAAAPQMQQGAPAIAPAPVTAAPASATQTAAAFTASPQKSQTIAPAF
jgi:hypothetical protein